MTVYLKNIETGHVFDFDGVEDLNKRKSEISEELTLNNIECM